MENAECRAAARGCPAAPTFSILRSAFCLLVLAGGAFAQQAQQGPPHIGYVYPAGGKQGTVFKITVGGQFLSGVDAVRISGGGVKAKVVEYAKPMSPVEFDKLKEQLKELQAKRASAATRPVWTAEDEKLLAQTRMKLATYTGRPTNPAIAEIVTVEVTIDPAAEPGDRELRLVTPMGVTDPVMFCVGQLPEFTRPAATDPDQVIARQVPGARNVRQQPAASPPWPEMRITLPATVNGQLMPSRVDRYKFAAKKGQKLVIAARARALIPYLPDAVPGWVQAALTLYDGTGKRLAYDDDWRFNPDPLLLFEVPADGDYSVAINDALYRGREDFVYRIAIGELPFITGIFPLGGRAGVAANVELTGWNLPTTRLTRTDARPGVAEVSLTAHGTISNPVPYSVDTLPECMEREPNDTPETAQRVMLPIIVNGRIDKPGDMDVFCFDGRKGERVVAEVLARRLDSPVDSFLRLADSAGRQVAYNDDFKDPSAGLVTHQADSFFLVELPADGTYYLYLGDAQHHGGPEYAYRLRLSAPRPDFTLCVTPSSINLRPGGSVAISACAIRRDGFAGEIALSLKDAPRGFALSGAKIAQGQDQARLTLTAPTGGDVGPVAINLEGRATIDGKPVVRSAEPAEDMMQAFAWRHLVTANDLVADVWGRFVARQEPRAAAGTTARIPLGGTVKVLVGGAGILARDIQFELSDPPEGISLKSATPVQGGFEIVLASDAGKSKVGQSGNLIVNAFIERTPATTSPKALANKRRVELGVLPAVPFAVVAR